MCYYYNPYKDCCEFLSYNIMAGLYALTLFFKIEMIKFYY